MVYSPAHTSSSSSATVGLDAVSHSSYHDSTSRVYSHHSSSINSSSSSLNPSTPAPRTNQPQNPQAHYTPTQDPLVHQKESDTAQPTGATTIQGPLSDAWAEHGHFPLSLDSVSRRTITVRGGSTILLKGDNFRAGVQVVIACPSLGESNNNIEPKTITPRVLKSTEMEFVVPNLLDWASSAAATSSKTLQLSVTLICAGGVKDISDPVIAFDMVAVEDSETELLHTVVGLHRQLIHASLTAELDLEAEQTARKRTLALLNLDRPPSVTRSEHLALGVIYMLCDGRDLISDEGMDIVRGVTQDGHDMLHLAVILGLKTLVRELARHLLGTFQSCAVTSESEVFTRDPNGLTALDFATILGDEEIEKVLTATLQAAQDHKRSILGRAHRPLPSIPPPQPSASPVPKPQPPSRASTLSSSPVLSDSTSSAPATETLDRPLPPTPLTSPYKDSPPAIRENHSYFPVATTSIDATIMTQPPPSTEAIVSTATVTTAAADHHPDQRIHTVQAIVEDGGKHDVQYHGAVPLTTMDHGPALYPGHNDAHVVAHQYPTYQHHQHQPHHDQHHQWQQQQPHHHQQQYYPHHQKYDYQQQHQEHYQQPLHSSIHHAPTLPSMPHLQSYGHNINPRPELPTPPRANSVPIPRPNNQHVPHHPQQPQQQSSSPLLENHSPSSLGTAGSYRPQPPAPLKAPSSLPPPKHIVTRVNRPKNFVVPTSTSETLTTTTGTTSMPLPEIPQHRPMMIPPLLPHPHAFPGANGHHHPMPVPAPVPVPMPMPMNHGMPQRHDSHGPRHNGDQIKVPVV